MSMDLSGDTKDDKKPTNNASETKGATVDLQQSITRLTDDITKLEARLKKYEDDRDALDRAAQSEKDEGKRKQIETRIDKLDANINPIRQQIAAKGQEIAAKESRLAELEKQKGASITISNRQGGRGLKRPLDEEVVSTMNKRPKYDDIGEALRACGRPKHPSSYPEYPHTLLEREEQLGQLADVLVRNWQNRLSTDHKGFTMMYIPGGSRIGKSALGNGAAHLTPEFVASRIHAGMVADDPKLLLEALPNIEYIYINFNNGEQFNSAVDNDLHSGAVRLGIRVASRHLLQGRLDHILANQVSPSSFHLHAVLDEIVQRALKSRPFVILVLHLDDINLYIEAADDITAEDPVRFFKTMMVEIGHWMREKSKFRGKFAVLPIASGAGAAQVKYLPTQYGQAVLDLKPLDWATNEHKSAQAMFLERFKSQPQLCQEVMQQSHFRIALADAGGIPGFIDYLLKSDLNTTTNWGENMFHQFTLAAPSKALEGKTNQKRGLQFDIAAYGGSDTARLLLSVAFTGHQVMRDWLLPSGRRIGEIEAIGGLFLTPVNGASDRFTITMPFMLLKAINQNIRPPVFDDSLLFFPSPQRSWRWQDFEQLHAQYFKVHVNALLDVQQAELKAAENTLKAAEELKQTCTTLDSRSAAQAAVSTAFKRLQGLQDDAKAGIPLSQLVFGALGDEKLLNHGVRPKPYAQTASSLNEADKFLTLTTSIATPSTYIVCKDVSEPVPLLDNCFLCCPGNALFDGRAGFVSAAGKPVALFWQDKSSDAESKDGSVSIEEVKKWHEQASKAVARYEKDWKVVLFYASNRRLKNRGSKDGALAKLWQACPNLLLVSRDEFLDWLSVSFAHRGLLAVD